MSDTYTFNPNQSADANQAFKGRQRAKANYDDPNQLNYKSLEVHDYADLRFLDMSKEAFIEIPHRKAGIKNPKNGNKMGIPVIDLGAEAMSSLVDQYGVALNDCPKTFIYRLPVYLIGFQSTDKNNKSVYTDVNELKFIEFGPGISKSLDQIELEQDGTCAFDEKSGLPHYDIRLKIVPGPSKSISKNYELEPIMFGKNKKLAESFGQSVKARFSADELEAIKAAWPTVMESLHKLDTLEEVKRQLAPREQSRASAGAPLADRTEGGNFNLD